MRIGIGIDTGGTYTDGVIYDLDNKVVLHKSKALTTKEDLNIGIGNALDLLPTDMVNKAELLSLSTTLATNACVENKGGRAKLIFLGVSKKLLDFVDIKSTYGIDYEDILYIESTNEENVINHVFSKSEEENFFNDAQSIAIAEFGALENGSHKEKILKKALEEKYNLPVVMANEVATELNVLERGATAILNARLLPIINEFISAVKKALALRNLNIKTMIVRSDGSLMTDSYALSHPVKTILSGPAASIVGGRVLSESKNSIILDMGGTTTDISIVENGQPIMAKGIKIGGYRTQVKGVFIDTFALGGDSRIIVRNNSIILDNRRVEPLCVGAQRWPEIKKELFQLVNSKKVSSLPLHEFLYLVRAPKNINDYNSDEIDILKKLEQGPLTLNANDLDVYNMSTNRLENEGIVMRCGLTPTDIMHVKGDFSKYDVEASLLGVEFLRRNLTSCSVESFCEKVYDNVCEKMFKNIIRILFSYKNPYLFKNEFNEQTEYILEKAWIDSKNKDSLFSFNFSSKYTLVGVGAPTYIFLPRVAKALESKFVIPEHAEVANAVGAIVSDISLTVKININVDNNEEDEFAYKVFGFEENFTFSTIEEAEEKALAIAKEKAISDCRKRGALGELKIETKVIPNVAVSSHGITINLGTTVEVFATGRV